MVSITICIIIGVAAIAVGLGIGILLGRALRKKFAEAEIGSAEEKAKNLVSDARKQAETMKKEALIEAKDEILRQRNEAEREIKERRAEVTRLERRLTQKEDNIDKKTEQIEKKNEQLEKKLRESDAVKEQIGEVLNLQLKRLEEISGLTYEDAKNQLFTKVEDETRHELSAKMVELEEQFKEEADTKAKNIISLAIQRCAADQVSETTISVVPLPSEDMKGRIIGREGRNIQKIEMLTGVDLIIDDTPEAITLSGFDPVKREVARIALEKLITDGRIHPTRIEETVEKAQKEVDASIKQAGERATFEVGIHGISTDLIRLLGRLRYRLSYGQNVLRHSIEVAFLAGMMADELGVDGTLARRAGLLHDIGKAFPHDVEGTHVQIGVNAAKKYKESREVIHAIEAHHNDVEPKTIIAVLVQAADAISAARPGARREDLENYTKRLEKLEEIAKEFDGVEKAYAIQAGRELRVMVKPEEVDDVAMKVIARDMAQKIKEDVKYPGQIKVHIIRESRAVDYAK